MARPGQPQRREENEVEFSRIVAFSDGVFAIAITLLVLNLSVPEHIADDDLSTALWEQRQDLFAYALSFAVIGRFWIVHHRFFGEVTGFDGRLLALNLFYLAWIVLIPFSSQVLGDHGGDTGAIVVYAANLAAVTLVGTLMMADARRAGLASTDPRQAGEFRSPSSTPTPPSSSGSASSCCRSQSAPGTAEGLQPRLRKATERPGPAQRTASPRSVRAPRQVRPPTLHEVRETSGGEHSPLSDQSTVVRPATAQETPAARTSATDPGPSWHCFAWAPSGDCSDSGGDDGPAPGLSESAAPAPGPVVGPVSSSEEPQPPRATIKATRTSSVACAEAFTPST
jgi:uncharacterized membrane protein